MSAYLLAANKAFMARTAPAQRARIECPHCGEAHQALKPDKGEREYNSITTCPHCDRLFYKVVRSDGSVKVRKLRGAP